MTPAPCLGESKRHELTRDREDDVVDELDPTGAHAPAACRVLKREARENRDTAAVESREPPAMENRDAPACPGAALQLVCVILWVVVASVRLAASARVARVDLPFSFGVASSHNGAQHKSYKSVSRKTAKTRTEIVVAESTMSMLEESASVESSYLSATETIRERKICTWQSWANLSSPVSLYGLNITCTPNVMKQIRRPKVSWETDPGG